jgi:hypothetical protein
MIVGGSVSLTVILNVHSAIFPEASVAVQVTGVVPTGKNDPDGGVQELITPGQLSKTAGPI